MDQAVLVGPDIEAGHDAVAQLDATGLKPIVAMLAMFPEYNDWRFVLSSPALDQARLLKAHEQVAKALRGEFVYRLPITMVLPTKDPFIRALRKIFGKTKSVEGMRLGGQMIGNRFLDSGYVYRIKIAAMVQHFLVKGRVQGVGFRWFVHREAAELGLHGWVRNTPDGHVEVLAAGEPDQLKDLMCALSKGSRGSRVDAVIEHTLAESEGENLKTFEIEGAW